MDDKLIVIAVENFSRAQILKAQLEAEGVECFLSNMNLIQASVSEGVKVMVRELDVKKAIKIAIVVRGRYKRDGRKRAQKTRHIRRILVPVDFSENSLATARFALETANYYGASVRFLHVYYSPAIDMISTPDVNFSQFNLDVVMSEIKTRAEKDMKLFLNKIAHYIAERGLVNVPLSWRVFEGITPDVVFQVADYWRPGIIIMGTHGQTNKTGSVVGSVVWKVIQKSKIPVISFPEKSVFSFDKEFFNIMFTTDLDDIDYITIRKLIVILAPFKNIKLHCVHASDKPINNYQKTKMDELKSYLSSVLAIPLTFNFIENKDYIKAFDSYVSEHKIDLISMSTRKRGVIERFFSPSLAKKMLFHATTPLMIIHV